MAPNLTAIADDFGFSADERDRKLGGEIALGFFVLGPLGHPAAGFVVAAAGGCDVSSCVLTSLHELQGRLLLCWRDILPTCGGESSCS